MGKMLLFSYIILQVYDVITSTKERRCFHQGLSVCWQSNMLWTDLDGIFRQ